MNAKRRITHENNALRVNLLNKTQLKTNHLTTHNNDGSGKEPSHSKEKNEAVMNLAKIKRVHLFVCSGTGLERIAIKVTSDDSERFM